jgi:hypothetical protein
VRGEIFHCDRVGSFWNPAHKQEKPQLSQKSIKSRPTATYSSGFVFRTPCDQSS